MSNKAYFCDRCERYHYRGNIYNKHKKFRQIKHKKQKLYKIKKSAWNKLSDLAKKQLLRLADKMRKTGRNRLYRVAISQLLEHELDKEDLISLSQKWLKLNRITKILSTVVLTANTREEDYVKNIWCLPVLDTKCARNSRVNNVILH